MIECKYQDIADEINKRDASLNAVVCSDAESLIHMENGNSELFNFCYRVLIDLGHAKVPTVKPVFDSVFHNQPDPVVKVY